MKEAEKNERNTFLELRTKGKRPTVIVSPGVAALGREAIDRLVEAICIFDDFNIATRAHIQHFCDAFVIDEFIVWFRIDYFDEDSKGLSPDPGNPEKTRRSISLKLSFEGLVWSSVECQALELNNAKEIEP